MKDRLLSFFARVEFQGFWTALHRLVLGGLGYMNADASLNGEDRYLRDWARKAGAASRPLILFDVGANEGEFSAQCRDVLGDRPFEVHCFEPNPAAFARLEKAFGTDRRWHLVNKGVGETAGRLPLYEQKGEAGSRLASFLPRTFDDIYPSAVQSETVEVISLDSYLEAEGIASVDYLKIDVEGFEAYVLKGMAGALSRGAIDRIQFEFNSHNALTGLTLLQISHMLPDHQIRRILPNGTVPVAGPGCRYNGRVEIFKYGNFVAERVGRIPTEPDHAPRPGA